MDMGWTVADHDRIPNEIKCYAAAFFFPKPAERLVLIRSTFLAN